MAVVQPVNYGIATAPANPAQSLMSGLQVGQGLGDALVVEPAVAQAKANQARMDMAQQQLMAQDLAAAKTPQAVAQLAVKYPQLAEKLKVGLQGLSDQEKTALIEQAQPVYAAALQGDTKAAADMLRRNAQAWRNSGNEARAKAMEDNAALVETNPEAAKTTMGLFLAQQMGPDKFEATYGTLAMQPAKTREAEAQADVKTQEALIKADEAKRAADEIAARINLTRAQTNRLYAQTKNDADRLGLDREKMTLDRLKLEEEIRAKATTLSETAQKTVATSADAAIKADALAAKMDGVADRFAKMKAEGVMGGRVAMLSERAKRELGFEDATTQARQAFEEIKTSKVLESLPPGTASDVDIEMAKKPIPDGTSDPAVVESYLRGAAKISRYNSLMERGKAEFVAQNGGTSNARADLVVNGMKIPAGASYAQFLDALQRRSLASVSTPQQQAPASRRTGSGQVTR